MEYKVGDKVRIRKDLVVDQWYGNIIAVQSIVDLGGTEQVINKVFGSNYHVSIWYMSEEMFEDIGVTIVGDQESTEDVDLTQLSFLDLIKRIEARQYECEALMLVNDMDWINLIKYFK
jgi:hypothetical protein